MVVYYLKLDFFFHANCVEIKNVKDIEYFFTQCVLIQKM